MADDVGSARRINARNVTVRDTGGDRGRGIFASRDFLPGEVVMVGLLDRLEKARTAHSIQMDWNVHALFEEPAIFVNHSCDPNLAIVPNRFRAYDFISVQEISPGVELTWDYATSEFECIGVPVCLCAAANCRQAAGGFSTLPPDHPLLLAGFYAPYLKRNSG
ncbi:SET domain-containing protein-lysine N-methyltransferase [Mesorhizobium sp. VK23B]|uniref:SET domain-containing protein-lysine N-methyltransferase n=1 Tax=Mesorhizobium dulcispinae TaxID=3072316 RepID=A0ABU4XRC3_9HYPH|nr:MULTISPECIES: SET domain-containing protein-lysine N-methyltransferase [unclassified Mesorhizobium]MDX8469770.1 SET domain-containing protein-lysine N-methyltransferase [Mesorhizobium sp. VK23B]MDX8476109.1 SET domain-containing protein-lysine N-methyltransferase [Mesorhizobium sp. VK23A]